MNTVIISPRKRDVHFFSSPVIDERLNAGLTASIIFIAMQTDMTGTSTSEAIFTAACASRSTVRLYPAEAVTFPDAAAIPVNTGT